jgi:DNA-directed RNA polymerase I subunit RPA34.5
VNFFQTQYKSEAILVSKKFNKTALNNLELWYITVPAGLPLDQLNQISWNSINTGDSILDHNGSSHGFLPANQECSEKIIAPKAKGYAPGNFGISRLADPD